MDKKIKKLLNQVKAQKLFGFLIAKGFLYGENIPLQPNAKIHIQDALWIGENIEPRVLEVLPAALIPFPKTFIGPIPIEFKKILRDIKKLKKVGNDYKYVPYKAMKRWADRKLPDHRTKKISEIKVNKTFRLHPRVISKLRRLADKNNDNLNECLEKLIKSAQ